MDFAIQGSFKAYLFVMIWQASLASLQQIGLQQLGKGTPELYGTVTRLVGTALSWFAWVLSVWVGLHYGVGSGIAFFALGFATCVLTFVVLNRHPQAVLPAHVVSLPAVPWFAYGTLQSIGMGSLL